jgi:hypothetical protein
MHIFLVWEVDHLSNVLAGALASNDRATLASLSHDSQKAANLVKSWCLRSGGTPVMDHPAIGVLEMPADRMTQLPEIRRQFEQLCSATMSVGVGMELSEAYVALQVAQRRGGDQIALYVPEMQEELVATGHLEKAEPESTEAPAAPADPGAKPEEPKGEPKAAIAQALMELKANAQALEHLKETNPEAFKAVVDTVQAMITMAQGLTDEESSGHA